MKLDRGAVVLIGLDPTRGHEQRGVRPCVIVSDSDIASDQRYPLVAVVPVTSTAGEGALYPPVAPGRSGLRRASFALTDQVRSVDKRRIDTLLGKLAPDDLAAIDEGLRLFLGLS